MSGIEIKVDDNFDITQSGGGVAEIDTSSVGDVIDPKTIASEAAEAAAENHELDNQEEAPLPIIDETNKPVVEDEEEITDPKAEEAPAAEEKPAATEEDEYETFKVLGKHLSDQGILGEYEEEMENTPEALQEMVSKTVDKGIEKYKDSFKHPMAKQFLDYLENGGDPGTFVNAVSGVDYNSIATDQIEGNTTIQKQLLKDQMKEAGETDEDIEDMIQVFEDAGQLERRSNVALKKLQTAQTKKQAEVVVEQRLMADSTDPTNQLLMSYLYFNKFDINKLDKKSKSTATKTLQEQLGRYSDSSTKAKARRTTKVVKNEPGKLNLGPLKKQFG